MLDLTRWHIRRPGAVSCQLRLLRRANGNPRSLTSHWPAHNLQPESIIKSAKQLQQSLSSITQIKTYTEKLPVPFFFDLSSLVPLVERNPFAPLAVPDVITPPPINLQEEIPVSVEDEALAEIAEPEDDVAEPVVDRGLPLPDHYDFDLMQALCQDPFRLFVYWHLKDSPFDRLRRIFPEQEVGNFHTVLKLIDETNNISVFFNAAFTREYWFSVFPDRRYRVELGLHSARYGYIKLLSSQSTQTPRGGPSEQSAPEEEYFIAADDYLQVLRESHLVPERAFTIEELLPGADNAPAGARNAVWESLPASFRRLVHVIADIQSGRDYERWWERLNQEELAAVVRQFLETIAQMGDGELGYMLLLRYLPELLRRAILAESVEDAQGQGMELQIDKPITLYLAEQLGQAASEINAAAPPAENAVAENAANPQGQIPSAHGQGSGQGQWLPSLNL